MNVYAVEVNDGVYGLLEVGYDSEFESYFFKLYEYSMDNSVAVEVSCPEYILSSIEALISELDKYGVLLDKELQIQLKTDQIGAA